tara:strand:+ start:3760 stop:4005 length:246 start_codon:yes stop_codon:yes gene_type:complete
MQLKESAKPLLNMTHINTSTTKHASYKLTLDSSAQFLEVQTPDRGTYMVPIQSISWMQPAKPAKPQRLPVKRKPPKSVTRK